MEQNQDVLQYSSIRFKELEFNGEKSASQFERRSPQQFVSQRLAHIASARHADDFFTAPYLIQTSAQREGITAAYFFHDLEMAFGLGCQLRPVSDEDDLAAKGQMFKLVGYAVQSEAAHSGIHLVKDEGGLFFSTAE